MSIPIYQPPKPEEATLSPATFRAVYDELVELTIGTDSDLLVVSDLEDKALEGRPHEIIGRKFVSTTESEIAGSERITYMTPNQKGINSLGKHTADEVAGHPIAYVNFVKDGSAGLLNGWLRLLDSSTLALEAEWRLFNRALHVRAEFAGFAGKVGLGYLFRRGGPFYEVDNTPQHNSYIREGAGLAIVNAIRKLRTLHP